MAEQKKKATGYDKYVNWKIFIFPVVLFFVIMFLPTPASMKKVGLQYQVGPEAVVNYYSQQLFNKGSSDLEQWQLIAAEMMERNLRMGAMTKKRFMSRNEKWC